jgi:hypothetical protein
MPAIDGIDFDDEDLFDADTTVAFAQMLHELGYDVTFCPYMMTDYWVGCLKRLNDQTPGLVTAFNLQCYAGGEGNDPGTWIKAVQEAMWPNFDAAGFVLPGLSCANEPPDCQAGSARTRSSRRSKGGSRKASRAAGSGCSTTSSSARTRRPAPGARWEPRSTRRPSSTP